jgi:hypothetical protein
MTKDLKSRVFDMAPESVKRFLFRRRQARRLMNVEFRALQRQFGGDTKARARYCHDRFDEAKHGFWDKLTAPKA